MFCVGVCVHTALVIFELNDQSAPFPPVPLQFLQLDSPLFFSDQLLREGIVEGAFDNERR